MGKKNTYNFNNPFFFFNWCLLFLHEYKAFFIEFFSGDKKSSESEFYKFSNIKNFLSKKINDKIFLKTTESMKTDNPFTEYNEYDFINDPNIILTDFFEELLNYDRIASILINYSYVKEKTSDISENSQKFELYKIAKKFYVEELNSGQKINFFIKFDWINKDEGLEIIDKIIKSTLDEYENLFYTKLENKLKMSKALAVFNDNKYISYLTEQREIAKKLNIIDNQSILQIDNKINNDLNYNFFKNNPYYLSGYRDYLRGYRDLDEEIKFIKNRLYEDQDFYLDKLNTLKKTDTNWIKYNIYLTQVKSTQKNKKKIILIKFIIIGLIVGVLVTVIMNAIQSNPAIKKKL